MQLTLKRVCNLALRRLCAKTTLPARDLTPSSLCAFSLSDAPTVCSQIRVMASIEMKSSKKIRCQHEYPDNEWKCGKCGYEILPELIGKIAETGTGRISSTTV